MTNERKNVLICGSGIFGLSTAYSLLKSNKYNVIIVEKSQQIPAYDSASTVGHKGLFINFCYLMYEYIGHF